MNFKTIEVKIENETHDSKFKLGVMREYFRIPNNVAVIAAINGNISENNLVQVLKKVAKMHPLTGVRVVIDSNQDAWFTEECDAPLPLKVTRRKSNRHWIDVLENEQKIPFDFEKGPLIRFILLKSGEISDLIVICQHSICDGLSLANIIQDIMFLLNNPEIKVKRIDPVLPVPANFPAVPLQVKSKLLKNKLIMRRVNRKWDKQQVLFDDVDYHDIHKAYTQKYKHRIIVEELSLSQTSDLVEWCHKNHVTVNSALSVAFLAGRRSIRGESSDNNHTIQIAVNIRDRFKKPVKRVFGLLASGIKFEFEYLPEKTFSDNVSLFHQKVQHELNGNKILEPLIGYYIDPTLVDGINFATYGRWLTDEFSRYEKLSGFIKNKSNKAVAISNQMVNNMPGLMISNLGAIKTQKGYDSLKLDHLYFVTSSSPFLDIVAGVVTASGKLTLTLNYMEDDTSNDLGIKLEKIMHKSIGHLTEAVKQG
ncbi:hypothetical protein [Methanobacterium sp.]|uniref:hypothetical protein n=1 Tax=Methanobacterium sp. TaxID=2164 RepID=UPI0031581E30